MLYFQLAAKLSHQDHRSSRGQTRLDPAPSKSQHHARTREIPTLQSDYSIAQGGFGSAYVGHETSIVVREQEPTLLYRLSSQNTAESVPETTLEGPQLRVLVVLQRASIP